MFRLGKNRPFTYSQGIGVYCLNMRFSGSFFLKVMVCSTGLIMIINLRNRSAPRIPWVSTPISADLSKKCNNFEKSCPKVGFKLSFVGPFNLVSLEIRFHRRNR